MSRTRSATSRAKPESRRDSVAYEFWMLHRTEEQLAAWGASFKKRGDIELALYCAVLEAFLVHARSLLDFFHIDPDRDRRGQPRRRKPDDFAAGDLVRGWRYSVSGHVEGWRVEINKRMQHLTTRRSRGHEWDEGGIRKHLDAQLKRFNQADPSFGAIVATHPRQLGPR
jgi:hypothetical protein